MDLEGESQANGARSTVRPASTEHRPAPELETRRSQEGPHRVINSHHVAVAGPQNLNPSVFAVTNDGSHANRVKDLASEISSLYPMLAALAGSKIQLDLSIDACPHGEIYLDSYALMQVLINLVRNSAEAIVAKGHILISARACMSPAYKSSCVLLTVEGDGPGIPPALLEKVFDTDAIDYAQQDRDQPRMRFKPRGLGLRIVRQLVELAGGNIRAVRLPDRGSRFEVAIPMVSNMANATTA